MILKTVGSKGRKIILKNDSRWNNLGRGCAEEDEREGDVMGGQHVSGNNSMALRRRSDSVNEKVVGWHL